MSAYISQPLLNVDQNSDLSQHYLESIRSIIAQVLENTSCTVYLFGSRARGTHAPASDVDIAISSPEDLNRKLGDLREALEFSTIPFFVDVVDLNHTETAFLEQVKNEGVVIWTN